MGAFSKLVLVAVVLAAIALGAARHEEPTRLVLGSDPSKGTVSVRPVKVATVDKSASMQQQRASLIQKLIVGKVFTKTGIPGTTPRVWVGAAFPLLEFDQKQTFVGVVYAYYFDGSDPADTVRVFDGYTDKPIGRFTTSGLELY